MGLGHCRNRPGHAYDVAEFVDAWRTSESVGEVAKRLGIGYTTACNRAFRLRERGHDLPAKPRPPRTRVWGGSVRTEELVDPDEVRTLVEAFRLRTTGTPTGAP